MAIVRDRSSSVKGPSSGHPVDDLPEGADTNVLFQVWLVARATGQALQPALAPSGLDADEFGTYSALASSDAMTPTELARWLSVPPTTVSSVVRRLESRGHLVRTRNPADGRSYVLALTDEGRAVHQAAGEAFLGVLGRVLTELGDDADAVRDALVALHRALDRITAEG
jgi:DNA-binding MarR family transcriptional regulator